VLILPRPISCPGDELVGAGVRNKIESSCTETIQAALGFNVVKKFSNNLWDNG
jgi:hypothetical protein